MDSPLPDLRSEDFAHDVFVLGTIHLREFQDQFDVQWLQNVHAALHAWQPTVVCVEKSGSLVMMEALEQAKDNAELARLLETHGLFRNVVERAKAAQDMLGRSAREAYTQASRLARAQLPANERARLAWLHLAAYDEVNAILHWSRLSPQERTEVGRSAAERELSKWLDAELTKPDEVAALAIPLARRLGHDTICSMDSHLESARLISIDDKARSALRAQMNVVPEDLPGLGELLREHKSIQASAADSGDLVPLYRFINDSAPRYEFQWAPLMRADNGFGSDRMRYTGWEIRNTRMVENILDATHTLSRERVLVIVGVAHKAILERYLSRSISVALTGFDDVFGPAKTVR
ncbi:MAG: DUF5694 domain-containing protein [Myxococcota bacterium]